MNKKIIVVAGNMDQFKYWLRHTIIPITNVRDEHRLEGITIKAVFKEGTFHNWLTPEIVAKINLRLTEEADRLWLLNE